MTTKLYSEALLEAKKLKEIAEEDAKKSIIESITPYIRKTISDQIRENSSNFFTEQDEVPPPVESDVAPDAGLDSMQMTDVAGIGNEATSSMGTPDLAGSAPLAPSGEDVVSATMPDSDGKIVVDFEDLFANLDQSELDAPGAGAMGQDSLDLGAAPPAAAPAADPMAAMAPPATPAPVAGEVPPPAADQTGAAPLPGTEEEPLPDLNLAAEAVEYKSFKKELHEVSDKIDYIYFKQSSSNLVKESLKTKLFGLLEKLDTLKEAGNLTQKQSKLDENKLEFLFLKLKEAKLDNSYNKKDHHMTSLKEYAAKLLFEGEDVNQPTTASGKHAADQSGVSPEVGTKEDLKGKAEDGNPGAVNEEMLAGAAGTVDAEPLPGTDPDHKAEKQWADGEAAVSEADQDKMLEEAINSLCEELSLTEEKESEEEEEKEEEMNEGAEGFGDTSEDPAVEFEVDEKALAEEVSKLRKESIKAKMGNLREEAEKAKAPKQGSSESWEDAEPEAGKDPSHENLKEDIGDMMADDEDVEGSDMAPDMGASDADMGSDVVMDDDMGMGDEGMDDDMGMGEDDGDLVLSVSLPDEVEQALADVDVSALDDISVELVDVNLGSDDSDDMGMGDEMGAPPAPPAVAKVSAMSMPEAAAYKKKAAILEYKLSKAQKESSILRSNLKEANLFLAKNVYFTKFLQRGDLSKKNLTKIVEYLDSAKTVADAKTIYGKIKAKLAEVSSQSSDKLVGSSSTVTKPGSALNEGVSRKTEKTAVSTDIVVNSVERWQKLAGMKVNK